MIFALYVSDDMAQAMFDHDIIPTNYRSWMEGGSLLVLWPPELQPRFQGAQPWEGIENNPDTFVLLDQEPAEEVFRRRLLPSWASIWWDSVCEVMVVWALETPPAF